MNDHDYEHTAWLWLMALPRVPWPKGVSGRKARDMTDSQIKIKACPGKLGTNCGAPGVKVSVLLPGYSKRITAYGNSLYTACDRIQQDAWRAAIQLPFLSVMHSERQHAKWPVDAAR